MRKRWIGIVVVLAAFSAAGEGTVDLTQGWRFRPEPEAGADPAHWAAPEFDDSDWAIINTGMRWENQGFPDVDGYAWYRRSVDIPAAWKGKPVWFVLGGINDAGTVFCNGHEAGSFGDHKERSMASTPVLADLTAHVRPGEPNLLAVRVYDWGASGGLWMPLCALTTLREDLPRSAVMTCMTEYQAERLVIHVDLAPLGNARPAATLTARAVREGQRKALRETRAVDEGAFDATLRIPLPNARAGEVCRVSVEAKGPGADAINALALETEVRWPGQGAWDGAYSGLEVRNNFVTELLHVEAADTGFRHDFPNPREGWVFISAEGGASPDVYLDGEDTPLVWRVHPETGAHESMRYLAEGTHTLAGSGQGPWRIEVRAVPELAYCYYLANPHAAAQGPYDRAFLDRFVLSNVNALITGSHPSEEEFAAWSAEGRRWIANAALPGLSSETAPSADEVYAIWAGNAAATRPGYGGMIVDEFLGSSPDHYAAWTEAFQRLHASPGFAGKTFYAWCGDLWELPQSLAFSRMLAAKGGRFAIEEYLHEAPTEDQASRAIRYAFQRSMAEWEAKQPGIGRRTVMCLGYMSAPTESLNINPGVDYNVFLDMQLHALATEPDLWGLYGVMEYSVSYADEEAVRWAHRLFRHYCIEGSRERLITSPYVLPHLANPDFAEGLEGWTVEEAASGSVSIRTMEGFSFLQGRYPRTAQGDQFLVMTRHAGTPNAVRQVIRALDPGQLYSLKFFSADIGNLHLKQVLDVSARIGDAEITKDLCFQEPVPSCYAHEIGPYTRDNPAWFNYHRVVFRPQKETVELTITDRRDSGADAADGQEIAVNFVEVQPYLAR